MATPFILTQSPNIRQLVEDATRVARSSASVLVTGETGTGKELFSKLLHVKSKRSEQVMVRVNCAALPENLIESELFGHERGAFTDAVEKRIGRFEFASGGTLLLDEISEVPLSTQAKLLRALEENEIQRVGSNATVKTDVRVIATSNRDLRTEIREGRFRRDLFHRLNIVELRIPPLRERPKDIPLLVSHFVELYRFENPMIRGLTAPAMSTVCDYHWPGNVRELRNKIHRACILSRKSLIDLDTLLPLEESDSSSRHLPTHWTQQSLAEIEKQVITATIKRYGSKRVAAEVLGVTPRTLTNKLKIYSSESEEFTRAGYSNVRKAA